MFLSSFTELQKQTLFCLAHTVAVSDGELSISEQAMMDDMRRECELSNDFVPHYIETTGMEDIFDSKKAQSIVLIALIRLAYADGAFEIEEQSYLDLLRANFGVSPAEFTLIENWVRRLIAIQRDASDFF